MLMILTKRLGGDGLLARATRGSAWSILGYGTAQAIRLGSNLILTRLLFPEAFGLMALVLVFMAGLAMFSDLGTGPSVMQNKRGDDPDFLDTAWTIQVIRGFCLWLGTCALAWPAAQFYGEPLLAQILPVSGLALLVAGFNPTRIEQAKRHLQLGRVVFHDIVSQVIGVIALVALVWWTRSVWALVFGMIISAAIKLALAPLLLPGRANRFRWDRSAAHELIHFGKWIFISSICGFFIAQGDKAILGKYLPLDLLGIYNTGQLIASFPLLLGASVVGRVFIPLYREGGTPSSPNHQKVRLLRFGLTGGILSLQVLLAFFGVALIGILYDPRFAQAGPIVVAIACIQIVQFISMSYDYSAIAAGDSRGFFYLTAIKAVTLMGGLLIGVQTAGLVGALAGQGIAMVLVYPLVVRLARRHGAWDPLHDAVYAAIGIGLGGLALWFNQDAIAALATFGR